MGQNEKKDNPLYDRALRFWQFYLIRKNKCKTITRCDLPAVTYHCLMALIFMGPEL